ncbi:MAG TPA: GAF domain-containing protein [Longimicrobium sp.]|jgi:GAF domain-containing protein|uniref:GAF domain-containing protein n=1 Tax=Longimicrobium sp. TaxID=2029185 RepID=UPI002ED8A846
MNAADPLYDEARLREIVELDLLAPDVDPLLQDVAAQAAARLGLPVSLISVVLDEALHVAGFHGPDGLWLDETRGHPVEWSFCATSVRTRDAFVVEDAAVHPYHRTNPLVTQDGVRCYAGVPLISSRGYVLGNLCVVGMEQRPFSENDVTVLRDLAAEAVRRIEQRRVHA